MIFYTENFRVILKDRLSSERGSSAKLAKAIGIHTTSLSQILSGSKPLSLEHAALICDYFQLTDLEADYFLLLVQLDRAGNAALKKRIATQITGLRSQSEDLSKSMVSKKDLSLAQQTRFYSDWVYSAIRVASSIPEFQHLDAMAAKLHLKRSELADRTEFLMRNGLCQLDGEKITPGPSYTHLPATSPLISKYHGNIRGKAMQHHSRIGKNDLAYSSILSISRKDQARVRTLIKKLAEEIHSIREETDPEALQILGIDWIEI